MANTLRFKRGLATGIPTALAGEPLFTTDTFDLYIGNGTTNTRFQKYIASGTTSQLLRGDGSLLTMPIVLTSPSNGQVLKYNGTSWVNDSDAGITGSGANGRIAYWNGTNTQTSSASLTFNGTNTLTIDGGTTGYIVGPSGEILIGEDSAGLYVGIGFGVAPSIPIYYGSNGTTNHIWTANTAERMRLTSNGRLLLGSTSDNGLRFQVTGDGFFSGSVGIGTTTLTAISLRVSKNLTGAVSSIGIVQEGQVQTDVTSAATGFRNLLNTAASTTLGDYYHIRLGQGTIGAGTTLTQQIGLYINDFANGTNRYGILSELSAGTGKWNLYMNGTAANYLAGDLGIGISPAYKFHAVSSATTIGAFRNSGAAIGQLLVGNTAGDLQLRILASGDGFIFSDTGKYLAFGSNGATERMRLDASGNLGLGVTPSAWESTARVFQFGNSGTIFNNTSDYRVVVGSNFFNNSGGTATYLVSSFATQYMQISGTHRWYTAPSGTSGNAITFTQAMTLDASGRLGIGMTAPTERLVVRSIGNSYANSAALSIENSNGANKTYITNANGVLYITNNTASDHLALYTTGNLSLSGTSDTGERLQVNGTMRVSGASTFGGNLNLPNTGEYYLQNAASTTFIGLNFDTPYIRFAVGGSVRAFMNATGLGLGTASPSARLDVVGVSGTTIIRATAADTNGNADVEIRATGTTGSSRLFFGDTAATSGSIIYNHASDAMLFSTAATTRATLDASGNLALGIATASSRLHVDAAAGSAHIRISEGGTTRGFVGGANGIATGRNGWFMVRGEAGLVLSGNGNSADIIINPTTANVQIGGTSDTGERLQVNGTMRVSGASTFGGNMTSTGQFLRLNQNTDIYINAGYDTGYAAVQVASNHGLQFATNNTTRMTITASGNLGLGVTPSAWAAGYKALQVLNLSLFGTSSLDLNLGSNVYYDGVSYKYIANGFASLYNQYLGKHYWNTAASGTAGNAITFTQAMTLDASGNLLVGSTTAGGSTTPVNISLGSAFGTNTAGSTANLKLRLYDDGVNTNHYGFGVSSNLMEVSFPSSIAFFNGASASRTERMRINASGRVLIGSSSDSGETFQLTGTMKVTGASTFGGLMTISGSATTLLQITSTGAASYIGMGDSSGSLTYIGSDDGTFLVQTPGSSYSTKFSINSAGAATFSSTAQAAGFITSGGTGYAVINSAATTVTALRPTGGGASIMSTNSNGLHIAVGTQAAGDLILASNNTERIRLSSNGFFSQLNATNPSASITDSYIQYSADVVAGNAAPHFRTENGAVIKLYQETTGVGNSIISLGGGNAVLDDTTFDGYTLRQIVKALRNQGILA